MSIDVVLDSLLEPISDENPAGVDLRENDDPNNIFRRVKDARNEARQEENQAALDGTISPEASRIWRQVWEDGLEYLKTQAKDLEIAAYMIEASIRLDGYRGLATALELTSELVSRFWGELLPTPDEDGIETTIFPISRLNGEVASYPMLRVPITADGSVGELVVWQHSQASQLEQLKPDERALRISRGAVTLEQFNRAVAETPPDFYVKLYQQLGLAREKLKCLNDIFEEKAGDEFAPNLSKFDSLLDEADSILRQIAGDKLKPAGAVEEVEEGGSSAEAGVTFSGGGEGTKTQGGIQSREDALNQLEIIAKWIEKHEPQSLLPSEIRKVIKRGKMTPQELYKDLISDSAVRKTLYRDVGIEVTDDN